MTQKSVSVPSLAFLMLLAAFGCISPCPAQISDPMEEREKGWQKLLSSQPDEEIETAITLWMADCLDGKGFVALRGYLQRRLDDPKVTVPELRLLARVWRRTGADKEALVAISKAASMTGAEDGLWLEHAELLARGSQFNEAMKSLDRISAQAPADTVIEAVRLRCYIARAQGKTEGVMSKLRELSEARSQHEELQQVVCAWEAEFGKSEQRAIQQARAAISAASESSARLAWRRLLVSTLLKRGELQTVAEETKAWLAETQSGSADEREALVALLHVLDSSRNSATSAPILSAAELGVQFAHRPVIIITLLGWLRERGRLGQMLPILETQIRRAEMSGSDIDALWCDVLVESDRHAEAVAFLQRRIAVKPDEIECRLRIAMIQHELGQNEEAARGLEMWAAREDGNQLEHERIAPILALLRTPSERQTWLTEAMARFPGSSIMKVLHSGSVVFPPAAPVRAAVEADDIAKQLGQISFADSPGQQTEKLLRLWRQFPKEVRVSSALMSALALTGKPEELWTVALAIEIKVPDKAARLTHWRRVMEISQARGMGHLLRAAFQQQSGRRGSVEYWQVLADWMSFDRQDRELYCLEEVLRLAPEDAEAQRQIASALLRAGRLEEMQMHAAVSPGMSERRLRQAQMDLMRGQPEAAARTLLELALDPVLDAETALQAALDLVVWRQTEIAKIFLAVQQARFPNDCRFTALGVLAMREMGEAQAAITALLSLATCQTEIPMPPHVRLMMRGYLLEAVGPKVAERGAFLPLPLVTQMAEQVMTYRETLARRMRAERFDTSITETLLPLNLELLRAWVVAHLVDLALPLPARERSALAARARTVGLPLPELIELGKPGLRDGRVMMNLDAEMLDQRLDEPSMAEFWLCLHADRSSYTPPPAAEATKQKEQIRRVVAVLTKAGAKTDSRLKAAMFWCRIEPGSEVALEALAEVLILPGVSFPNLGLFLQAVTLQLTTAQRREPAWMRAMNRVVDVLLTLSLEDQHLRQVITGHFLTGRWTEAAQVMQRLRKLWAEKGMSVTNTSSADANTPPVWMLNIQGNTSILWPPALQMSSLFQTLTPQGANAVAAGSVFFTEDEKPAFLAAAQALENREDRLAWLLAGKDERAVEALIQEWWSAEPASPQALSAVVSLAMKKGETLRVLDLLHAAIPEQRNNQRWESQMRYLRAAFFPEVTASGVSGRVRASAPESTHRERVIAILHEWLPTLRLHAAGQGFLNQWREMLALMGMTDEIKTLTASAPTNQGEQQVHRSVWNEPEEQMFKQPPYRSYTSRQRGSRLPSAGASQRLDGEQRRAVIGELLVGLWRMADRRFLGWRAGDDGESIRFFQELITQQGLAAELMKAAEPGRVRTWRLLVHSAQVAEACGEWARVKELLTDADRFKPGDAGVQAVLLEMELRLGSTPEILAVSLTKRPRDEAEFILLRIAQEARGTQDIHQRLNMVEVILRATKARPEMLVTDGISVFSKLADITLPLLSESFSSSAVNMPALFATREPARSENKAPAPDLLARRKSLHDQFCMLLLTRPPVQGQVLQQIALRHLVDGQPTSAEFIDYLRRGVKTELGWSSSLPSEQLLGLSHSVRRVPEQLRLARLIIALMEEESKSLSTHPAHRVPQLLELIGAEIPAEKFPPLWALWESPMLLTMGTHLHTSEQKAWNEERLHVFEEYTARALEDEALSAAVFPYWAGWALHHADKEQAVLNRARKLYLQNPDAPRALAQLVELLARSYENDHHIRSAELVVTLLDEMRPPPVTGSHAETLKKLLRLLQQGRNDQSHPMPSITLTPKETERLAQPLAADLQRRRLAVYGRLLKWLGEKIELPAEAVFTQLEKALRSHQDTQEIEQRLIAMGRDKRGEVETALLSFIKSANGRYNHEKQGAAGKSLIEGGEWEPDLRLHWFSAAWRVGRPFLEGVKETDPAWLNGWLVHFMQPNPDASPPIPPVLGLESGRNYDIGPTLLLFEKDPSLRHRDKLYLEVLRICMDQRLNWSINFPRYLAVQAWVTPTTIKEVVDVIRARLPEAPGEVAAGYFDWVIGAQSRAVPNKVSFAADIADVLIKDWPKGIELIRNDFSTRIGNLMLTFNGKGRGNILEPVPGLNDWSQWNEFTNKAPPEVFVMRERWHEMLAQAVSRDELLKAFFLDYARVYLEKSTESVSAAAERLVQMDGGEIEFDNKLRDYLSSREWCAPISRRMSWGRMALTLLKSVRKPGAKAVSQPVWLAGILEFVSKTPPASDGSLLPEPAAAVLAEREALLAQLRGEVMNDLDMAVEAFASHAQQQMMAGTPPEATLELARKILARNAERLGQQINLWCGDMSVRNFTAAEHHWMLQVLVPLAEEWPDTKAASFHWLYRAANTLTFKALPQDDLPESDEIQFWYQRFLAVILKQPDGSAASCLALCGRRLGWQPTTRDWLVKQLLNRLTSGPMAPTDMAALFQAWWGPGGSSSGNAYAASPNQTSGAYVVVGVLKKWPVDAKKETLLWTEALAHTLALTDWQPWYSHEKEKVVPLVPGVPEDVSARLLSGQILEILTKRGIDFPWLQGARLRHLSHAGTTAAGRIRDLATFFKPPLLTATTEWLEAVLARPVKTLGKNAPPNFGRPPVLNLQVEEIFDVARLTQTAVSQFWLSAEAIAILREKVPDVLKRIAQMAEEASRHEPFARSQGVTAAQGDAARKMLEDWSQSAGSIVGRPVTHLELASRIAEGLRIQEPLPQLADLVWRVVRQEPKSSVTALETWARQIGEQGVTPSAYLRGMELASALAARWSADLPPPDWLVRFIAMWNSGPLAEPKDRERFKELEKTLLPQLAAVLEKYPDCQDIGYFQAVLKAHQWDDFPPEADTKTLEVNLANLAVAHLRAVPARAEKISLPGKSAEFSRVSQSRPLFSQRVGAGALLFAIEHAFHIGKEDWLEHALKSVPAGADGIMPAERARKLSALYFCPAAEYGKVAEKFAVEQSKSRVESHTWRWLLRVARLRGLEIPVADWLRITKLAESTSAADVTLITYWMWHLAENSSARYARSLQEIALALVGPDNQAGSLEAALTSRYRDWRDGSRISYAMTEGPAFEAGSWDVLWHLLVGVAQEPDLLPAVMVTAEQVGLLSQRGAAAWLCISPRCAARSEDEVTRRRWIVNTGLMSPDLALPESFWIRPSDGLCPLWEMGRLAFRMHRQSLLGWLREKHAQHPTPGTALLMIAASREEAENVPVSFIEAALAPCRSILEKQPSDRLAELAAALQIVQPRLRAQVKGLPAESVLRLLPEPAIEKRLQDLVARWKSMTSQNSLEVPANQKLASLGEAMCRLLSAQVPEAHAVFRAGVSSFGATITDEVAALAVLEQARQWQNMRTVLKSRNMLLEMRGVDDTLRHAAPQALAWLLHESDVAFTATSQDVWYQLCSNELLSEARSSSWDGRAFAHYLNRLQDGGQPGSVLFLFKGLKGIAALVPGFFLDRLLLETRALAAAAPEDIQLKALSWTCARAFEHARTMPDISITGAGIPPITQEEMKTARDLWAALAQAPLAVRSALAETAPVAVTSAEAKMLWIAWAQILFQKSPSEARAKSQQTFMDPLRWMPQIPADDEAGIGASKRVGATLLGTMQQWTPTSFNTIGSFNSLSQSFIAPLLELFQRQGLDSERQTLLKEAARTRQLPLEVVLNELRSDPSFVRESMLPLLFPPTSNGFRSSGYTSGKALPALNADEERLLKTLDQPEEAALAMLLAGCPDSDTSPPKKGQAMRLSAILSSLANHSDSDASAALYPFLAVPGPAEAHLQDLLPLLRRHPQVQQIHQQGGDFILIKSSSSENTSRTDQYDRARLLALWTLAEALHGDHPELWFRFAAAVQIQAEKDFAADKQRRAKFMGLGHFSGLRLAPAHSPWLRETRLAVFHSLSHWLATRSSDQWQILLPVLASAGDLLRQDLALDLYTVCLVAEALVPDARPWTVFRKNLPVRGTPQFNEITDLLGRVDAVRQLTPAIRWQIVLPWLQARPTTAIRLLTAPEIASLLPKISQSELAPAVEIVLDWLHARHLPSACHALVTQILYPKPAELTREQWKILASWCRDQNIQNLAKACDEQASEISMD